MALIQDTRGAERGFAVRIAGMFQALSEAYARHKVYRQTLGELQGLSARELNDLGINRAMITRVAIEAAYGK